MHLDILSRAQRRARRAPRGDRRHRSRRAATQRLVKAAEVAADPLQGRARQAHLRIGQERHGGDAAGQGVPHRARAAAAARHHRRGAHQPGAGADRRSCSATTSTIVDPRTAFASAGALPRREGDRRVAGRGAAAARHRPLHGLRRADARSEDRRSGAAARAGARLLLYRRARLAEDPRPARRAAEGAGRRPTPTSRASMRRSGSTSARCRRPRSRSRSWARSRARLRQEPDVAEGRP